MKNLDINELLHKTDSSCFLYVKQNLLDNVNNLKTSFSSHFDKFTLAYSIKSNYYKDLLNELSNQGISFEVASCFELNKLLDLNVLPKRIWINTPFLEEDLIRKAIDLKIQINIDSLEQLETISNAATKNDSDVEIGIRLNLDEEFESRFGIEASSSNMNLLFSILSESRNLVVTTLHTHHSGENRSELVFQKKLESLIEIYKKWFAAFPIKKINIGGGFAGPMPSILKKQFHSKSPSWNDYASTLSAFSTFLNENELELLIEPGMALVADCFLYLAEVLSIKTISDRNYCFINSSKIFLKPTGHSKNLNFEVIKKNNDAQAQKKFILSGITCMENDLLGEYEGSLSKGDYILFYNVGAYTLSYRPDFIFSQPKILNL